VYVTQQDLTEVLCVGYKVKAKIMDKVDEFWCYTYSHNKHTNAHL